MIHQFIFMKSVTLSPGERGVDSSDSERGVGG